MYQEALKDSDDEEFDADDERMRMITTGLYELSKVLQTETGVAPGKKIIPTVFPFKTAEGHHLQHCVNRLQECLVTLPSILFVSRAQARQTRKIIRTWRKKLHQAFPVLIEPGAGKKRRRYRFAGYANIILRQCDRFVPKSFVFTLWDSFWNSKLLYLRFIDRRIKNRISKIGHKA